MTVIIQVGTGSHVSSYLPVFNKIKLALLNDEDMFGGFLGFFLFFGKWSLMYPRPYLPSGRLHECAIMPGYDRAVLCMNTMEHAYTACYTLR